MNNKTHLLDSLLGIGSPMITSTPEKFFALFEEKFGLHDLGISSKALFDWKNSGLLPDNKNEGRNHRFSFIELMYMYLIRDLREMGYPIRKTLQVRAELLQKHDSIEAIKSLDYEKVEKIKQQGFDADVYDEILRKKDEIVKSAEKIPAQYRYISAFAILLFIVISERKNLILIITNSGGVALEEINKQGQATGSFHTRQAHIQIPLFNYFLSFMSVDKYIGLFVDYQLLDDKEMFILNQVREGKYDEITINFKDSEAVRMKCTKELRPDSDARLREIFMKGGYQDLEIKSRDGKISYAKLSTHKKL